MRKKTSPFPEAPPAVSGDRLAALEAEIAAIRAEAAGSKFQPQDALPQPAQLSGWQLSVQRAQDAARERRQAAAAVAAIAARAQAPAQAKRDADLRLLDAELDGVHHEYHVRVKQLTEDRARLVRAPLDKVTRHGSLDKRAA